MYHLHTGGGPRALAAADEGHLGGRSPPPPAGARSAPRPRPVANRSARLPAPGNWAVSRIPSAPEPRPGENLSLPGMDVTVIAMRGDDCHIHTREKPANARSDVGIAPFVLFAAFVELTLIPGLAGFARLAALAGLAALACLVVFA